MILLTIDAQIVLEYVQALAWPMLAALIVIAFRSDLSDLIKRLKGVTGFGVSGETWPPPSQTPVPTSELPPPEADPSLEPVDGEAHHTSVPDGSTIAANDSARVAEAEDLRQQLADSQRDAALANLNLFYERTYRLIFGTQIQALQFLNTRNFIGVDPAELMYYLNEHHRLGGDPNKTLDPYLGFMVSSTLIYVGADGKYYITGYGRGLLQYIIANSLSFQKIL
jgi:hypothetical protein